MDLKKSVPLLLLAGCASGGHNPMDLPTPTVTSISSPSFEQQIGDARAELLAAVGGGSGVAVSVRLGDDEVWREGIGWSDIGQGIRIDPNSSFFRIYSVAKPMTATAAARLMEQRRLDPAAPVQRYVPDFPDNGATITPMHLAQHQSGIRHYRDEAEGLNPGRCETVDDAVALFAADPLVHAPGEGETYSSWGYVLLSAVVGAAAGQPFEQALRDLVFGPAGIDGIKLEHRLAAARRYPTWVQGEEGLMPAAGDNSCRWGAGGYVATAPAVSEFGRALVDGRLLSSQTQQLFLRGTSEYRAQGVGEGGTAFLHTSAETGLSVALLSNTSGPTHGPALQAAFQMVISLFSDTDSP